MGKFDYLEHQFDDEFQQTVQSDLDMLLLEKLYENNGGLRGGPQNHTAYGWRKRGMFFWVVLLLGLYWFILRPLGL